MKKTILTFFCVLALAAGASAQDDDDLGLAFENEDDESGAYISGGFDLTSAYAWRGNLAGGTGVGLSALPADEGAHQGHAEDEGGIFHP